MKDILFLEDDKLLASSVIEELTALSLTFDWVSEGEQALEASFTSNYSLYLFDVNVPTINGFEVLQSLRESGDRTPAIFLTSKNQIDDIKAGFESGADDYIKKPFDLDELIIRITSKLPKKEEKLSADFTINRELKSLTCKGVQKRLTLKEYQLLEFFLSHQEVYISAEDIIYEIYEQSAITVATLRTYIKTLKRQIEGCAKIENMKGVGYRFSIV